MSIAPHPVAPAEIVYPDSDGQPMADNTRQAEVLVYLKTNLDDLFAAREDVFVAMDLLWYPAEGHPEIRLAPDILVAVGRPKGHRGSYRQWAEDGVAPQVVFEVLSPGNRRGEMDYKFDFYQQYGVEEYYTYDPHDFGFSAWRWSPDANRLRLVHPADGCVSPILGVRFDAPGDREWQIIGPNGRPFRPPIEVRQELERTQAAWSRAEADRERAEAERDQATAERDRTAAERDRLAAKLRELGVDPADIGDIHGS
jgi:Uma2 family endonuclease